MPRQQILECVLGSHRRRQQRLLPWCGLGQYGLQREAYWRGWKPCCWPCCLGPWPCRCSFIWQSWNVICYSSRQPWIPKFCWRLKIDRSAWISCIQRFFTGLSKRRALAYPEYARDSKRCLAEVVAGIILVIRDSHWSFGDRWRSRPEVVKLLSRWSTLHH